MVRHQFLVLAFGGSSPSIPAKWTLLIIFNENSRFSSIAAAVLVLQKVFDVIHNNFHIGFSRSLSSLPSLHRILCRHRGGGAIRSSSADDVHYFAIRKKMIICLLRALISVQFQRQ